jgi:hypothetical protein
MINEKFKVRASLVAEAAAVGTLLESIEVCGLGTGLADRAVRVESGMGAP